MRRQPAAAETASLLAVLAGALALAWYSVERYAVNMSVGHAVGFVLALGLPGTARHLALLHQGFLGGGGCTRLARMAGLGAMVATVLRLVVPIPDDDPELEAIGRDWRVPVLLATMALLPVAFEQTGWRGQVRALAAAVVCAGVLVNVDGERVLYVPAFYLPVALLMVLAVVRPRGAHP